MAINLSNNKINLLLTPCVIDTIIREEENPDGEHIEHNFQKEYIVKVSFFLEDIQSWTEHPNDNFFDDTREKVIVKFKNGDVAIVIHNFINFCALMSEFKKQQADLRRIIVSN